MTTETRTIFIDPHPSGNGSWILSALYDDDTNSELCWSEAESLIDAVTLAKDQALPDDVLLIDGNERTESPSN